MPATMAGPVYIEGPKPGDTLKIEVLDDAPLDYGWIGATPGRGPRRTISQRFAKPDAHHPGGRSLQRPRHHAPTPHDRTHWCAPQEGSRRSNDKGGVWGGMVTTQITKMNCVSPRVPRGWLLTIGDCRCHGRWRRRLPLPWNVPSMPRSRVTIEERFKVRRPVVATATEVMTTGEGETMEAATKMAIGHG